MCFRKLSRYFTNIQFDDIFESQVFKKSIISYPSIHLLVKRYNNIMCTLLIAVLVTLGIVQVIPLFTLKQSQIPMVLIVFLTMTACQATQMIIVAYGFAGNFNQESFKSLKSLNEQNRILFCCKRRKKFDT